MIPKTTLYDKVLGPCEEVEARVLKDHNSGCLCVQITSHEGHVVNLTLREAMDLASWLYDLHEDNKLP